MDEDYDHNFGFMLNDVARLMRITYDRRMKPLGLTRSQWWVLTFLYFHEGVGQSEFAGILDIDKATLGRLLERLETKGWVRRTTDKNDRRLKRVHLTKKAQPTLQVMRDLARITRNEALASLSEKEHEQLLDMLQRIRRDLTRMNGQDSQNGALGIQPASGPAPQSASRRGATKTGKAVL